MIDLRKPSRWVLLIALTLVMIGAMTWGIVRRNRGTPTPMALAGENAQEHEQEQHDTRISVQVIHPKKGSLQRLSTQPGSIQAWETVRLFAKVPGFLKWQNIPTDKGERRLDIGDEVKIGQKLAVVDVPELEAQQKRNEAAVKQARSRVDQMKARVESAEADLLAADAAVKRAVATAKAAAAWVRYRELQLHRMEALVLSNTVELKLQDEAKEHYDASVQDELAAIETITANKAKVIASKAKIKQVEADVEEAKAEVEVTQAEFEKVKVQVAFATITAPFDGVITQRNFFPGDYIRSANEAGNEPLLTVQKTDKMRVIVQIPDRDVPFTDPGDDAFVLIDALPGEKLPAKVSRIASHEDPQTRLMRVEIDLPNPTGKIRHGMYGKVTIVLDQEKNRISIPSSCVIEKQEDGRGTVYVVRDGHAHRVPVRLSTDNGLRVAILEGLTREDKVILRPGNALSEGTEVTFTIVN